MLIFFFYGLSTSLSIRISARLWRKSFPVIFFSQSDMTYFFGVWSSASLHISPLLVITTGI